MNRIFKADSPILDSRFLGASIVLLSITGILSLRLWYVQVFKGDYYRKISERNRIRKIEIPAARGIIYDRYGQIVLGNRPFYDLVLVPQYLKDRTTTLRIISRLLHIPLNQLERRIRLGGGRPKYLPITLKRNLSLHEVSTIEASKLFLPGIEVRTAPRRDYRKGIPVHMVGYLGEIDPRTLKKRNREDPGFKYQSGDLIGKQGLESQWERYLRGRNGYRLIQVDALGRESRSDENWDLPRVSAKKGADIELTIDMELQRASLDAFKGKYGAVVALDPNSGEILAMVSEPSYDPTIYQRSLSREEWYALVNNPLKPLFDKTTGGEYIPGSIYKSVVALAALEEKLINLGTTHHCPGFFTLGEETFHCWERNGHGIVGLKRALMRSCDVYFYHVGVELGADKIAEYARKLGLGTKLGINLNLERPGLVPTSAWKKLTHRLPWTAGDTPNVAIGQGYNLLTPLQMASLYATIANSGYIWKPYLVKRVTNEVGETVYENQAKMVRRVPSISEESYQIVRRYLKAVVMDPEGTGKNARVEGFTVAGKTGSAQVVSLKKSNKSDDVSIKWKEHAIFTAFSPVKNAEIALAIVSENDAFSGGGAQAAPIAKKIIKKFWDLKQQREKLMIGKRSEEKNEL